MRMKKKAKFEMTRAEVTTAMILAVLRGTSETILRTKGYATSMKAVKRVPQSRDT